MIIIGYQGIGKSTLANNGNGYIDLESSNFWVDGVRADNWYAAYCSIAEHLSSQGYSVFTSSHEVVRNQLRNSKQRVVIACPSVELKDAWINRLEERHADTGLDKDCKALMNAKDRHTENITELLNDKDFEKIVISQIPYCLDELIKTGGQK